MKILFISHSYPPIVGGVETQNFELYTWLSKIAEVRLVANRIGRKILPIFAPYALLKALFGIKKYDVILLGNGILFVIGWFVGLLTRKPVICVIHGLDVNYNSRSLGVWYEKILIVLYQKMWIGIFSKKINKFVAVGNETVRIAKKAGIAPEKIIFIPNGIDLQKYSGSSSKEELEKIIGEKLDGKKTILTSGRLAKRKGVAWFVANVLPLLPEDIIYVVAGDGPDRENIQNAIDKNNMAKRVKLLGYVSDPVRDMLFHTCDVFVQPNIKTPGDMEGFGISVIEAAYCGIPVVAARLEGLQDAIKDGQDGFLVESGVAEGYASKINELLSDDAARKEFGQKARQFVIDNYSWEKISKRYLAEIKTVISGSKS